MNKFEYSILTGRDQLGVNGGVVWFLSDNMEKPLGPQLQTILNQLGSEGWEVAGIGDVAYSGRPEILLKRQQA